MTLICTVISNLGLLQASDSALVGDFGAAGTGQKVFRLGFTPGALALAGAFSVGGVRMSRWMDDCIRGYGQEPTASVGGFASHLCERFQAEAGADERADGILVHIAGYVGGTGSVHPEMHFVRNATGVDPDTGDYIFGDTFVVSEDFWTRDYQQQVTRSALANGGYQRYFNGAAHGRSALIGVSQKLEEFLIQAWSEPAWCFRAPATLAELGEFLDLEMRAVSALYSSSDYVGPPIGGPVQLEFVAGPDGAIPL